MRSAAGFAINIILARVLGPEPFGIVAVALLIIGIGNLIIESGLGSSIIQKEEITSEDIAFVFTLQMLFGISLFLIIIFIAPWLADQFNSQNAVPVIQVMAFMLILQAFAQVPSALLRRNLNFKRLQIAQISSFFVGYLVFGIPLALTGFGVWSLVAAQVIQSGLNATLVYLWSRHNLSLSLKGSSQITVFGLRILFANIANWLIQYIDQAVIGKRFGAQNLGLYSRAYFLNWTPVGIILSSAQATMFSAISRIGKSEETSHLFLGVMKVFAIFFFPVYWLIALEAKNIIYIIYGPEWLPAADVLIPLAVSMPFLALVGLEGPVLNGLGKPHYEMWAQWITAIFAVIVLTVSANISLIFTAWSILSIYLFRLAIMSIMTIKVTGISIKQLIYPVFFGLGLGTATVVLWFFAERVIAFNSIPLIELTARCLPVVLVLSVFIWIGRNQFFPEYPQLMKLIQNYKKEKLQ